VKIPFRGWRLALSLASGLALALAFPNYNLPLLGWVSVAGLLYAILDAPLGQAALCGFLYGMAYYTFSIPWVYTVLQQYGPLPVWEASGVFALLAIALSVFCAFFAAMTAWLARRSVALALVASPFLWVAVEFGRMRLPQPTVCFPWDLLGYVAAGNLALVQITSVTGIYGLSFLVVAYAALLVWAVRAPSGISRRRAVAVWVSATMALVCVDLFDGHFVPQVHPDRIAHLVQTDLPQALDYPANWDVLHAGDLAQLDNISISAGLSAGQAAAAAQGAAAADSSPDEQPGLLVWPEVPAPFSLQQPAFAQRAERLAQASHDDFLVGELNWKVPAPGRAVPYNSAALLDPQGREQFLYDKMHLVPFGEFFPWRSLFWFAGDLEGLSGDFGFGTRHAVGDLPGGKFGVFICYEAIFPDHVRQFVLNGAGLLINISNDGWFGRSAAAAQHLNQARVRAVENRRWLLRDTNNGYTVSIDPYGRIVARMPADIRGELDAPYAFRDDRTLYTQWGDWVPWLSLIVSICFVIAAVFWRKTSAETGGGKSHGKARGGQTKAARKAMARNAYT
jgi:apolipoprotein N-acyltransferase